MVEGSGSVLRRNWYPVLGSALLLVLGVLTSWVDSNWTPLGYFGVWLGVVLGPLFYLRNAFPRSTAAAFRASAAGIAIEGLGEWRAEDILEARITPRGHEAVVDLALRDMPAISLLARVDLARSLVELLGARRTRFRLIVPYWRRFFALFVLITSLFVLAGRIGDTLLLAVTCGLLYAVPLAFVVGLFLRGRLVIGADGFTTRWLFWERFVPFREVTSVMGTSRLGDPRVQDTLIELTHGRKRRLHTVEAPNTEQERGTESAAMLHHMKEAFLRSTRLLDGRVDVPTLVQRGSLTADAWLSGLDALVRGGGSRYRVAAVSPEMLTDLTHDPNATPEVRVGAAAALLRIGDEVLRARVRVAAEACADTELRETLLALTDARTDTATVAVLARLSR